MVAKRYPRDYLDHPVRLIDIDGSRRNRSAELSTELLLYFDNLRPLDLSGSEVKGWEPYQTDSGFCETRSRGGV